MCLYVAGDGGREGGAHGRCCSFVHLPNLLGPLVLIQRFHADLDAF